MNPKARAFKIEDILNSSVSAREKAIQIHEQISATAEETDETIPLEVIEKSFSQMRKNTFRGFRSAILLVIADNRLLNIFAINRNLLRMDYQLVLVKPSAEVKHLVKSKFKLPVLQ